MRKLLSFAAAMLLSVSLMGCSGDGPKDPKLATATPTVSGTPSVQATPEGSGAEAGKQGNNGSTDGSQASTKKPPKEHQLTMNIDSSTTKAYFQNGPSAEEIKAYQKRLRRKPKRKKHYSSGQNAPVYDTEMVEVNG